MWTSLPWYSIWSIWRSFDLQTWSLSWLQCRMYSCRSELDMYGELGLFISTMYYRSKVRFKTILFDSDMLAFWSQLEEIRFVKTLSTRRMFVSCMKISACWLVHRLIKFNKICWEKRPVKPRPNLRTSFWRRDLRNTQTHLEMFGQFGTSINFCGTFKSIWDRTEIIEQSWYKISLMNDCTQLCAFLM